jgi:hypothetical protein
MGTPNKAGIFTIVVMIGSINFCQAQVDISKWQIGINGGVFVYLGDLTPSAAGSFKTLKPTGTLYISRVLTPSFILRTNLVYGLLAGNESKYSKPAYRRQRNLSFSSSVKEVSELLVWNMYSNNNNEIGKRFSPYLFAGAGISFLNINRSSNLNKAFFVNEPRIETGLAADLVKVPPSVILVLPVGVGVEYYLFTKVSLTAETDFRYTFTDYVDGFSLAANPEKNDFYQSYTLGLVFKFTKRDNVDCPVLKY